MIAPVVSTVSVSTFGQVAQAQGAVGEAQHRHVRRADGGRLGRREAAAEDAAEDDDRRAQRRDDALARCVQTRAQLNSVRSMLSSRRTQKNTTMHSPSAISRAGTTDAANSAPVETAARPA